MYLNPCEFLLISPAFSNLDAAVEDMALLGFYQRAVSKFDADFGLSLGAGCSSVLIMLIIIQAWPHPKELPWLCRAVKGM